MKAVLIAPIGPMPKDHNSTSSVPTHVILNALPLGVAWTEPSAIFSRFLVSTIGVAVLCSGMSTLLCAQGPGTPQQLKAGDDVNHPLFVAPATKPQSSHPSKCAASDPIKAHALDLKILSGDYLTTARQPDQALAVCNDALQASCNADQTTRATACITGAIAQKAIIESIQQKLQVIDSDLACFRYKEAQVLADQLKAQFPEHVDGAGTPEGIGSWCKGCFSGMVGDARLTALHQYVQTELGKRPELNKVHPWWQASEIRGRLGGLLGVCPAPSIRQVIVWLSEFLVAVAIAVPLIVWLLGLFWFGFIRDKILPEENLWIVWSVIDETKCGSAGAVMDALDSRANPLLRVTENGGISRLPLPKRPQLLLAPPYLPQQGGARLSALVWADLLGMLYGVLPYSPTVIEDLPQDKEMPKFYLDPAYDEVDVSVAGFTVKGVMGLRKLLKLAIYRRKPSVVGVVSQFESESVKCWSVRLNANRPGKGRDDRTISVYAENSPQEYGDPLSQVAQRAAFKLVLRILNPQLDANLVTAMAAYRQGVEMLRQLL